MSAFHPDLALARYVPKFSFGPRLTRLMQKAKPRVPAAPDDVLIEDVTATGPDGVGEVSLRVYRPRSLRDAAPALFWIHGGGFISGSPEQDEASSIGFARSLGITVVALRYRLAPTHPSPAAVEDAYAGLLGVFDQAEARGIDPERIAIGGASAGGGLAAGLVLYAHDRGEVRPAFQLLVYPMLDDRTVTRTDMDTRNVRIWSPGSNRFGWTSYLGVEPGSDGVSPYAAPARRGDLSGLPPAWIGVGSLDLFHDEDLAYAARLEASGVPCDVVVVPGAPHGFDAVFRKAAVSREFWRTQAEVLRLALFEVPAR
ncbi:alpha/beta hydrolase [Leifsonia sp. Leaf264]|uniref:alpha/beta hydrolase n=1 Tax=Leifsonia sp. Leaf264 TaxID=1736314 RepID=UPI0006FB7A31|nr:alpha/beta hydrolase [Leifsonia sp. Leaf264]KQO95796.1 alpha/beta hydrolase [Leifsonia sp. Leaf264]